MRLQLTIAYDGRPFEGWATQPSGQTVQDIIQEAIRLVAKQNVTIFGSGRTDAGVHAIGQVAHFDVPSDINMNPFNWVPALNSHLPPTIRIMTCEEVDEAFHARFSAVSKTYTYDLCLQPVLPPLMAGLAWHLPRQIDRDTLEQAMTLFLGEHDFRKFSAKRGNETESTSYVRVINRSEILDTETGYQLIFTGNGFLYKMVRMLTGAAVYASQGRISLDDIERSLRSPTLENTSSHPTGKIQQKPIYCAPPGGLTLKCVSYA